MDFRVMFTLTTQNDQQIYCVILFTYLFKVNKTNVFDKFIAKARSMKNIKKYL